jgi:hypothetical protein
MATTTMATTTKRRTAGTDGGQHPDPRRLDAGQILDDRIAGLLAEADRVETPAREVREAQKRAAALRAKADALRKCRDAAGCEAFRPPDVQRVEATLAALADVMRYEFDQRVNESARIPPVVDPPGLRGGPPVPNERWQHADRQMRAAEDRAARFKEAREKWVAAIRAGTAPAAAEAELKEALSRLGVTL